MCQEQSKSYRARAGKTLFATQAPKIFFIISYVSKNVYSSHAKSMLPFSKHRSRGALRAGLVAIRSRQRVSERRSPEQGEHGSAGCWPQKIHPHTQLLQAQAKTRSTRKHPAGCKQAELISPKALGKHHWPQQSAVAHSFSRRQTLGRWAKISGKIVTDRQIYAPTLYLEDTTASFKARAIFPKYPGYFASRTPDHFSEIFRIFRR